MWGTAQPWADKLAIDVDCSSHGHQMSRLGILGVNTSDGKPVGCQTSIRLPTLRTVRVITLCRLPERGEASHRS